MSPATRDPVILAKASERLGVLAKMLDTRVCANEWIGGKDFTFADIACGHILYRYFSLNWQRPELANLDLYYDRLQTRPSFAEHVMVSYEALRGSY
jgi:glutathione S-transferase